MKGLTKNIWNEMHQARLLITVLMVIIFVLAEWILYHKIDIITFMWFSFANIIVSVFGLALLWYGSSKKQMVKGFYMRVAKPGTKERAVITTRNLQYIKSITMCVVANNGESYPVVGMQTAMKAALFSYDESTGKGEFRFEQPWHKRDLPIEFIHAVGLAEEVELMAIELIYV